MSAEVRTLFVSFPLSDSGQSIQIITFAMLLTALHALVYTMKAVIYVGLGKVEIQERPMPKILEPTDAIVKLSKTTLCGNTAFFD